MVYILLAEGFEEAEALVPADLLRRAGVEVKLTGVSGALVAGGHHITVQCDTTLDKVVLTEGDMVMLPGGGLGVQNLGKAPAVEALVREAVEKHLWVSAICAAPTLLARWGLLEGKQAVCYPSCAVNMAGALMQEGKVARDGKFITGQAAGGAHEFGLALIEALVNADTADRVKREVYL